jgi:NADPH:quinone reductase-like Zn-dependent oxidoreductase
MRGQPVRPVPPNTVMLTDQSPSQGCGWAVRAKRSSRSANWASRRGTSRRLQLQGAACGGAGLRLAGDALRRSGGAQATSPVLVTGASGNVGSVVVELLLAAGVPVRAGAADVEAWERLARPALVSDRAPAAT